METIIVVTEIAAPIERCFLLSLSIDLHMESAAATAERAIAGVTRGIIGPGETVTWRGRHFGCMLTHESRITKYDRPHYFQDVMVRGAFRSFEHNHFFERGKGEHTLMRDELRFEAPFGLVGRVAEVLVLRRYLKRFLIARNHVIRTTAEGPEAEWLRFTGPEADV
ncbi:MAG TPA: SRPBCC family protein [Acidobacteriaceae bacterium]|nr:SRPBCC family protein [Acidobacteriaceae bacterium]